MSFRVLFIIAEDPRASGRPAEAVRIAAGVSVWQKVKMTLYLRGPSLLLLGESSEDLDLVDAENCARYFPLLREEHVPIYVQQGAVELARLGQAALPFAAISDPRLAELAAAQNSVLSF
jgi:sulfur relay (sulfurtransferase) DsrF/TusC family protein